MAEVVWLASYPKSGNTWMRALLAGYFGEPADAHPPLDLLLEFGTQHATDALRTLGDLLGTDPQMLHPEELRELQPVAARTLCDDLAGREGLVFQKLHGANLRARSGELIFPPGAGKALYIVRNPLDVAPSWAAYFGVSVDEAIAALGDEGYVLNARRGCHNDLIPEPLFSWSGHVRSWLDALGVAVHVVRYEDLLADAPSTFSAALRFLGTEPDADRVAATVAAAGFERLRENEAQEGFVEHWRQAQGPFFRNGQAGGWRDALTPAQARRVVADHEAVMRRLGYGAAIRAARALPETAEASTD